MKRIILMKFLVVSACERNKERVYFSLLCLVIFVLSGWLVLLDNSVMSSSSICLYQILSSF